MSWEEQPSSAPAYPGSCLLVGEARPMGDPCCPILLILSPTLTIFRASSQRLGYRIFSNRSQPLQTRGKRVYIHPDKASSFSWRMAPSSYLRVHKTQTRTLKTPRLFKCPYNKLRVRASNVRFARQTMPRLSPIISTKCRAFKTGPFNVGPSLIHRQNHAMWWQPLLFTRVR